MHLSFIVPSYNEEENVKEFYQAFFETFGSTEYTYELIFVDDGSTDNTLEELRVLAQDNPCIRVISFSRNFSKESAIYAGLRNATGDIIGIIDADLQQTPATALEMVRILETKPEYDCVAAFQENRRENKILSKIKNYFYRVLSKSSQMDIIDNASDFRIFRDYVGKSLLDMTEYFRFSKGLFSWVGFNTYAYPYTPEERHAGTSKWSFFSLVRYAIEGIVSFTVAPLHIATILGFITSAGAILYFIFVFIEKLLFGIPTPGYATIVGLILLIGGMQLFVLGIMGEYIGRMYIQTKSRPIYIEKENFTSQDLDKKL
ncbi:MAG: glycosyltransferase family 2 protein [Raoultibacter sp.]